MKIGSSTVSSAPKQGAGILAQLGIAFVILGILAYPAIQGYQWINTFFIKRDVAGIVANVSQAANAYTSSGYGCSGFSIGSAAAYFEGDVAYTAAVSGGAAAKVTFGDGTMSATADCSDTPAAADTTTKAKRPAIIFTNLTPEICTAVSTEYASQAAAIQATSTAAESTAVVIKKYLDAIPSGRDKIGVSVCTANTAAVATNATMESTTNSRWEVKVWLQ